MHDKFQLYFSETVYVPLTLILQTCDGSTVCSHVTRRRESLGPWFFAVLLTVKNMSELFSGKLMGSEVPSKEPLDDNNPTVDSFNKTTPIALEVILAVISES